VEPIIDLAPGADDNELAVRFAALVRENVRAKPHKRRDFRALRGAVLIVAEDAWSSLTMRFDHGRLTIHDGGIGIPTVTFCGHSEALLRLADVPLTPLFKLPLTLPFLREGRATYLHLISLLGRGDLKIYGLLAHPRLITRFLRVLSIHG